MIITKNKNLFILFLVFLFMLAVNLLTPLFADDFNYSFMWDKSKRIENLIDVFKSQQLHYFQWGGRTVAHSIGQTLLMTSKISRSFFNAIIYVALNYLIYWHSLGKKIKFNQNVIIVLLITFFCWISLPNFGETTIWLIGSVNYLWTAVIILLFLIPYRLKFLSNQVIIKNNLYNFFGMFLLGLLAGWSNENTSLSVLLLGLIIIVYSYKKQTLENWMLIGLVGVVIGYLFLILSPGNMLRASHLEMTADYSFVLNHIKVPVATTINIMKFQIPVWITFFILISALLNNCYKKRYKFKDVLSIYGRDLIYSLTLITFSILNNLMMFASPYFPLRAGFGSSVFLIIGVLSLFRIDIFNELLSKRSLILKLNIMIICFLVVTMGLVLKQYTQLYNENNFRMTSINKDIEKGNYSVTVKPFSINNTNPYQTIYNHVFISDIGVNPNIWPNTISAQYFGLKSIKQVP